jgi:hypothetical protein
MKFTVFLFWVALLMFPGCSAVRSSAPDVLSLQAQDWDIQYSPGMPAHPSPAADGAWFFDFPADPGSVHYVSVPYNQSAAHRSVSITFRITTTGAPFYNSLDTGCNNTPAHVRLYLQRQNDDMRSDGNRWWSNPASYELGSNDNQTITIEVPLTAEKWSGLSGQFGHSSLQSQQWFQNTLSNLGRVGMTFGGGCSFGHGVNISGGTARFTLIHLAVV